MEEAHPFFSIIIPTYNRFKELAVCLDSLTCLDYPRDCFEVIVVGDGGSTLPEAVVDGIRQKIDVKLLTQAHAGPAGARNFGAKRAKGMFLAFTDDDCIPKADWLKKLAARFAQAPDHLVGGRTLNARKSNPYSTTSQLIVDIVYSYYNQDPKKARFFASNNLAIPAERFHELAGFDATFRTSEDRELCDRWLHHGYHMTYAPEAIIYHEHILTLAGFLSQHFGYGRGAFRFHKARARRGSGRFVQELGFYARFPTVLRRMLSQVRGRQALYVTTLLVAWQCANAAGFFWEMNHIKRTKKDAI